MMSRYPYRVVSARWTKMKEAPSFIGSIRITGVESTGIVNRIADVLSANNVSIRSFNYKMDEGLFEGTLNIMVPNNDILHGVMRKIQAIKGILKVTRSDSA
jgi:GTP diphosphokinase / guanosine-3',5'-bis(diphosphate) 3'-diphosphatase